MAFLFILLSLLVPIVVSLVFLPRIVCVLAQCLGQYLRRHSNTRRGLLLARVANEAKAHEAKYPSTKGEDDDWEQIGTLRGSTRRGGEADCGWSGIVGFFHPFWYEPGQFLENL